MAVQPIGPVTGAPDELIGDLADWALEQRKEQVDPDSRTGGTWVGAVSHPIFEGLSTTEITEAAAEVQAELDVPEPTADLLGNMHMACGVHEDGSSRDVAEDAAVVAAAIFKWLAIPQPTPDNKIN